MVSPFVAMNCAALPANLIQSELFGHEKGAFTGASERRIGPPRIRQRRYAVLDEIGDLAPNCKPICCGFWRKEDPPPGQHQADSGQCPVIAATNTHLEQVVRDGRFREDLYYRLNVLHLRAPALRERKNDVELLAKHFFTKFAAETRTSAKGLSRDALEVINRYDWPGNVRELMNRVRRAVLLSEGPYVTPRRSGAGTALAGAWLCDPGRSPDGGRSRNDPVDLAANPLQHRPCRPGTGSFAHDAVSSDGEIRYSAG